MQQGSNTRRLGIKGDVLKGNATYTGKGTDINTRLDLGPGEGKHRRNRVVGKEVGEDERRGRR